MRTLVQAALATAAIFTLPATAQASLSTFKTFVGNYGLSTDGSGSLNADNTISAFVPFGATVTGAYLYQANHSSGGSQPISFNGDALIFDTYVPNGTACCSLGSSRADVTSIVSSIINGGAGGTYDFTVTEGNTSSTDGTALVVVYSLASLPTSTVAILDGFASVTGDITSLNFADPLDPTAPGFFAEMRLGINFSCCSQMSTVEVNGTLITEVAGNNDDGAVVANGSLITVGGNDDPFSALLPSYADDHERYNLVPYITLGDTSIVVKTANGSRDDNIFLAAFAVTGEAGINEPPPVPGIPEPATWLTMIMGFGLVGVTLRRRQKLAQA